MNTDKEFNELLWEFYDKHGRHDLPWRLPEANGQFDPYKIVVSELMLQQTQVQRVIPKFHDFLQMFPDVTTLAQAPLAEVLKAWSGLGYNRRAKFIWHTAQQIQQEFKGIFPDTITELVTLAGIGKNTAGAVMAYAFNRPEVFIETNVRTVYIHHFFQDHTSVSDAELYDSVKRTLDHEHPREFYWAIMDYGSNLKQTVGNLNKFSSTYNKQSKFEGSKRQVRGQVLRILADRPLSLAELSDQINDDRLEMVLQDLVSEKLITQANGKFAL
ncbi:endonuclease III [soil metagenome]